MPELPDVVLYVEHLERRVRGATLERARVVNPNLLRTAVPPLEAAFERRVSGVRRIGKRIAIALDPDLFLVLHLMIAGRLHWRDRDASPAPRRRPARSRAASPPTSHSRPAGLGKFGSASFGFTTGTLTLTEAGTHKRAALHLVRGAPGLGALDPGGIEVMDASLEAFRAALTRERHTLKRALTDPRLVSGIGNAYSDEILHRARLSPLTLTDRLSPDEFARLLGAARETLEEWTERLRRLGGDAFPEKVTAFREEMAVHGRYRKPCSACGALVQRIVYAENETNYCARCQTGGRLRADRALSRLLKGDWPRTLEELES